MSDILDIHQNALNATLAVSTGGSRKRNMSEKSAKGVNGCLLYSPYTMNYFFRVYDKDSPGKYEDYDIHAEDINVTITDVSISLYRGKTRGILDFSSRVLRRTRNPGDPASRIKTKNGKPVLDENGKFIIESGTYGEDLEFIPNQES